jgi:hypothetical protein
MRKKGNIVRYTAEQLAAMQARGEDRTDLAPIAAKTEAELAADMAGDPAWEGVAADWVSHARAATGLMQRPKENKRQGDHAFRRRRPGVLQARRSGLARSHERRAPQLHGGVGTAALKNQRRRSDLRRIFPTSGEGKGGGVDNMMWGSDYTHSVPRSRRILADTLAGVPVDEQAKPAPDHDPGIARANSARVYNSTWRG